MEKQNFDVHSMFQIAWKLILSATSTRLFIGKQNKQYSFAFSYRTRRILFNVYVALIHVVSLVVNVIENNKSKTEYDNLLTAAKLKRFYLLTKRYD